MASIADHILGLPSWLALMLVFLFPALEASVFVGLVFPGEIAVVLGGVLASDGRVPFALVLVVASAGAIIGDSVGYAVGQRYGIALIERMPRRLLPIEHVHRAAAVLNRFGGRAVVVGRFTAAARALVPGLCGIAHMRYRTFLTWNVVGGVLWATGSVLIGFLAGTGYRRIEHRVSEAGYALLALVVLAVVIAWLRHRRRTRRDAADDS